MQRDQQPTKDFTALKVVLMMIVVGVVLLFFLYPTRIINRVSMSNCQSNLKMCAIALQLYSSDYNDMLPSSIMVNHSKKWNKADFVKFATIRGEIPVNKETRPQTLCQILSRYIDEDAAFCVKDTTDHSNPKGQVSYWYKLAIDKAWYGEGCVSPYRGFHDFEHKADQIVFYENRNCNEAAANSASGLKNGALVNVAYLDSHAKSIRLVNSNKPAESEVWTTDPTASGEPAYFNCKYNANKLNPPPSHIPTTYIDPNKYIDKL